VSAPRVAALDVAVKDFSPQASRGHRPVVPLGALRIAFYDPTPITRRSTGAVTLCMMPALGCRATRLPRRLYLHSHHVSVHVVPQCLLKECLLPSSDLPDLTVAVTAGMLQRKIIRPGDKIFWRSLGDYNVGLFVVFFSVFLWQTDIGEISSASLQLSLAKSLKRSDKVKSAPSLPMFRLLVLRRTHCTES
jgi:hypothetical protein